MAVDIASNDHGLVDSTISNLLYRRPELYDHGMSTDLRTAIFAVTSAVATADSEITNQEEQALRVVAEGLELGETAPRTGELLPADLDVAEREMVYACAAWLAGADSVTATAETELLTSLRASLRLAPEVADALQSKVDALRARRRRYLPRSEQLPWWEEFGELLHRLHALPTDVSAYERG